MKIIPIILSYTVQFTSVAANAASQEWAPLSIATNLSNARFMSHSSGDHLESDSVEATVLRTMCRLFHEFDSCIANLECFWDDEMNLCNKRSNDDLCSLAPGREICILYKENCYWDGSDHRCVARH